MQPLCGNPLGVAHRAVVSVHAPCPQVRHNLGELVIVGFEFAGDLACLVLHACEQLMGMCWIQANQQLHVDRQVFADNVVNAQLHLLLQPTLAGSCWPAAGC